LKLSVLEEKRVVGAGYNPNCMCPRCHSIDRHRHVYLYLKNKTVFFDQKRIKVLHVAPEMQWHRVIRSHPNIDYVTADLNSPFAMVKMDITNIEYEDNVFDVIICNHVLEHIPDDRKAMSELYRVLKPGGWAILQVPISLSLDRTSEDSTITTPEEREKIFGQEDHVRIYAKDYKDRLVLVGFRVKVDRFEEKGSDSDIRKYGLLRDENIYVCSKPEQEIFL
jgi:SAM-dependent methyltransferase